MQVLPCCIEVPPLYEPKARYSLETLLYPLGLQPQWVTQAELKAGGLYYGILPLKKQGVVAYAANTAVEYFSTLQPLPQDTRLWQQDSSRSFPIPIGLSKNPDWIGSAFFWLSDWQTQYIKRRDVHGRFLYKDSEQAGLGIPPLPLVDYYREALAKDLRAAGISVSRKTWHGAPFALAMTHDIDHIYKWNIRRWLKEGWKQKSGWQPEDGYTKGLAKLLAWDQANGIRPTWFFKADAHAPQDDDYALKGPFLQTFFEQLKQQKHGFGLHPGYFAHSHPTYMQVSKQRLEKAIQKPLRAVRQHYLRWEPSITPKLQVENGFEIDSSLGFVDYEGCRNGTCFPFQIFDLEQNMVLPLWEFPLILHDTTLLQYRKLSPEAALAEIRWWLREVHNLGGLCTILWHNVIYEAAEYPNWAHVFEQSISLLRQEAVFSAPFPELLAVWTQTEK